MTGTGGTWVSNPRSPVHNGAGNQYNVTYHWSSGTEKLQVRAGVDRLQIVREHRLRLARCFVYPRGYARAADRLTRPGAVVILQGAPGSGRRSAATMLLEERSTPGCRIEELQADPEEGVQEPSPGDCYLLDLSHVGEGDYSTAQRTFIRYRSLVEKHGARMVAVFPAGLEWMLDAELVPLAVALERPRGRAVLSRHLRVRGVPFAHEQLGTDELSHMFATAPMRELDRLAELVARARDSAQYGTDFVHWRDEAMGAATNWSRQVARQLREHRGGSERALLLAAAMMSGAAADTVVGAAGRLLELVCHPRDETPVLAQEGLGERFEKLSLVREVDGRVRFGGLAYDAAVRRHFWENFPDLRPGFREWVEQCTELPELVPEERTRFVGRFAEQALSFGRPDDLVVLVEKWTRPSAGGRLSAEAATLLELGLSDELHGSLFRHRVYEWAATRTVLEPDLARVLIGVCRHVIAVTHPGQAVVRLRHLAVRQELPEALVREARSALLRLARRSRRLYVRSVGPLLQGVGRENGHLDVLLELLEPEDLLIEPPWQEFTLAWRAVMGGRAASVWSPVVQRWLTLLARGEASDQVLDALLLAAAGDRDLLNRLYVTTCDWADSRDDDSAGRVPREDRTRTAEAFRQKIDRAQGVGGIPSGSGARGSGEGT
ncbi:hypothetical protein EES43_14940 [Streptomyces sp. ADI96-02]|uniref:hypothetical protein n=1 Tax=Streptomyces sp. ADI96-02 TaxID=1522760 RepID=UPI000F54D912|nr:hypothetical protein [Streptomyces sp. ADI96-02]RPK61902.1 hypothetical protein EES43_14940 [Streptomyces sp. ADI96-02]